MLPLLSQLVCVISCSMFGSVAYVTCHGQWQLHFCNVAVYRASFRQTYAEINARTGEWKIILAGVLFLLSVSGWFTIFVKRYGECSLPVYSFKSIMVLHCYWACLLLVMFSLFYIWSLLLWVSVCHKPSHCIYMHTQSHTASSNTKHSQHCQFSVVTIALKCTIFDLGPSDTQTDEQTVGEHILLCSVSFMVEAYRIIMLFVKVIPFIF